MLFMILKHKDLLFRPLGNHLGLRQSLNLKLWYQLFRRFQELVFNFYHYINLNC